MPQPSGTPRKQNDVQLLEKVQRRAERYTCNNCRDWEPGTVKSLLRKGRHRAERYVCNNYRDRTPGTTKSLPDILE